jgi:hypothetical protein
VGTNAAVVVNSDALANVIDALIVGVVSDPLIGESVDSMRPVAEGLVFRTATAAEGNSSNGCTRLAIGTTQV